MEYIIANKHFISIFSRCTPRLKIQIQPLCEKEELPRTYITDIRTSMCSTPNALPAQNCVHVRSGNHTS